MPDCPLCTREWHYVTDRPAEEYLCDEHKMFMHQLDQFLAENHELLGRLAARERLERGSRDD